MRWVLFGVLLLISMSIGMAASSSDYPSDGPILASCNQLDDFATLVGGSTPNSSNGFGAVDICSNCYPCGNADGICPEDFYSGSQQGACGGWPDPDCTGLAGGSAKINFSGTLQPAVNVRINVRYDPAHLSGQSGQPTNTNISGEYEFNPIKDANASVWADYNDPSTQGPNGLYVSQVEFINGSDIYRPTPSQGIDDLILQKAPCQADCTRGGNLPCDGSCNGVNGCQFQAGEGFSSSQVASAVDGSFVGDRVTLGKTVNQTSCTSMEYFVTACEEPVQSSPSYLVSSCSQSSPSYDESILNLVTRVHRVWYDAGSGTRPLELVIMHWDESR